MSQAERTREIVRDYSEAWRNGDMDRARTLLADELDFEGSIDRFIAADPFMTALAQFQTMLQRVEDIAEFYRGGEAILLYDCVTESPAGTIRTAEFFVVENEKIAKIRVVFDATKLRPSMRNSDESG